MKKHLLYFVVAFFTMVTSFAQTLDQSSVERTTYISSWGDGKLGQSFVAGVTGSLSQFSYIHMIDGTTKEYKLEVYSGEGYDGELLGTQLYTPKYLNLEGEVIIDIKNPISIVLGNTYTVFISRVDKSDFAAGMSTNNPYSKGKFFSNTRTYDDRDLWFNTFVSQEANYLNFDGVQTINSAPTIPVMDQPYTVEAYVKPSDLLNTNGVLNWKDNDMDFSNSMSIALTSTGISYRSNTTTGLFNYAFDKNTWYHIAASYNGATFKVYVDGTEIGSVASAPSFPASAPSFSSNWPVEFVIGVDSESNFFKGGIDDVRLWNVCRTPEQILASKNCELTGDESGLAMYYKFNQGLDGLDNSSIPTILNAVPDGIQAVFYNFDKTGTSSNFLYGSAIFTPLAPATTATQSFCGAVTVANLAPAPSTTISWYADKTSTTALESTFSLANNTTYYVEATNAKGCKSERVAVPVSVNEAPVAPTITDSATPAAEADLNVVITDNCAELSGNYGLMETNNGKNLYVNLETQNSAIIYDGEAMSWMLVDRENTVFFTNPTASTDAFPPTTGWVSTNCSGSLSYTTISGYQQKFCETEYPTVASLKPEISETIKWYSQETGGVALKEYDELSTDTYYVASVNSSGCESERIAVKVRFYVTPETPIAQTEPDPEGLIFSNISNNQCPFDFGRFNFDETLNGKSKYSDHKFALLFDGTKWIIQQKRQVEEESTFETIVLFENTTASTGVVPPTTGWTSLSCLDAVLTLEYSNNEGPAKQTFCQGATVADIKVTGSNLNFAVFSLEEETEDPVSVTTTDLLIPGYYLINSTNESGCKSEYAYIEVSINALPEVATVTTPVTYVKNGLASPLEATTNETGLVWYASETSETSIATPTPSTENVGETSYWVSTTNENGCESARTEIVVIVSNSLSVSDLELTSKIKMYPNPANSNVTIETVQLTNVGLQVYDTTGKILMNTRLKNNSNTIDVSQFPVGLYVFKVSSTQGTTTTKVVKK